MAREGREFKASRRAIRAWVEGGRGGIDPTADGGVGEGRDMFLMDGLRIRHCRVRDVVEGDR